ncbi:MAG: hypothetical protein PW788_11370 [Micavibrio sp.]|nr:hypothetical protein [Micavibrio sp.]
MINRVLLSFLTLACLVFVSCNSFADAVPGCNPQVLDAMQKKAQAKVAADINNTEQTINKPDSVLAMTCFNKAAGTSAAKGGSIFSGDFTSGLTPIIEDALQTFYKSFDLSLGKDSAVIDYSETGLTDDDQCDNIKNLWNQVKDKGVQTSTPFLTQNQLTSDTLPTGVDAGSTFEANWNTEKGDQVFSQLNAAINALPKPSIPSFSGMNSSCAVLNSIGYSITCP